MEKLYLDRLEPGIVPRFVRSLRRFVRGVDIELRHFQTVRVRDDARRFRVQRRDAVSGDGAFGQNVSRKRLMFSRSSTRRWVFCSRAGRAEAGSDPSVPALNTTARRAPNLWGTAIVVSKRFPVDRVENGFPEPVAAVHRFRRVPVREALARLGNRRDFILEVRTARSQSARALREIARGEARQPTSPVSGPGTARRARCETLSETRRSRARAGKTGCVSSPRGPSPEMTRVRRRPGGRRASEGGHGISVTVAPTRNRTRDQKRAFRSTAGTAAAHSGARRFAPSNIGAVEGGNADAFRSLVFGDVVRQRREWVVQALVRVRGGGFGEKQTRQIGANGRVCETIRVRRTVTYFFGGEQTVSSVFFTAGDEVVRQEVKRRGARRVAPRVPSTRGGRRGFCHPRVSPSAPCGFHAAFASRRGRDPADHQPGAGHLIVRRFGCLRGVAVAAIGRRGVRGGARGGHRGEDKNELVRVRASCRR